MNVLKETKERFERLFERLGLQFTMMIVFIEHILQGFIFGGSASGFIGTPILYLMRRYGTLTASRIQVLKTVAISPWALKALFGSISDTLYVSGYNKLPYILSTLIIAAISCLIIALVSPLSPTALTVLLFFIFLQIAVSDLLIEARYPDKTNRKKKEGGEEEEEDIGPDLMVFIGIGVNLAQIFSIILTGIIVTYCDSESLHYIYLLPVPFFLVTVLPVYWNWLGEKELEPGEKPLVNVLHKSLYYQKRISCIEGRVSKSSPVIGMDLEKIQENKNVFSLSLIITVLSLTSSIIGLLSVSTLVLSIFSLVSFAIIIVSLFVLGDRRIAMIQTYAIIQNMFSISPDTAAFFFYTDDLAQYPEGPHFSNLFYVMGMGIIAVVFSILGQALYSLFMTRWRFRGIFLIANLLSILVNIPTIFFYLRWNLALGIPDSLFVIGSEALSMTISVWTYLPLSLLMYRLCPEGTEATVFAILAGSSNLGSSLSQYQSAFLLDLFNVKPTGAQGESEQFKNLWIVQVIAVVLPLVPILTIPFLIPDATQTDSLEEIEARELEKVSSSFVDTLESDGDEKEEEMENQT